MVRHLRGHPLMSTSAKEGLSPLQVSETHLPEPSHEGVPRGLPLLPGTAPGPRLDRAPPRAHDPLRLLGRGLVGDTTSIPLLPLPTLPLSVPQAQLPLICRLVQYPRLEKSSLPSTSSLPLRAVVQSIKPHQTQIAAGAISGWAPCLSGKV